MKKLFAALFFVLAYNAAEAQFYYRDIITNKQLFEEMALIRENKVRSVVMKSFEADGSESEGFFCERKFSKDHKRAELFTRSDISGASLFTSYFDTEGKLLQTRDSSAILLSVNSYFYDDKKRVKSISTSIRSSDDEFTTEIHEEHIYTYLESDLPESMMRVKNRNDSTLILFQADEKNNIGIEKNTKTGSKYYYYYDDKNRLTDIVHANEATQKLLPDYLFAYNNAGQIAQMTATEAGSNYYYIWRYTYNNGLRTMEKCYSKEKRLMGTIEYVYK